MDGEIAKTPMSPGVSTIGRITKNMYMISLVFLFEFSAFQGLANLQSSINCEGGLGTISLAVTYFTLMISSFFVPTFMLDKFGPKWTILMCICGYMVYTAANYYPVSYTLIPAAVIMGAAGAPLLTSQAAYVTTLGYAMAERQAEANKGGETRASVWVSKYFGIFFFFFEVTQLTGNLLSSVTLSVASPNRTEFVSPVENPLSIETEKYIDDFCGAQATNTSVNECPTPPDEFAKNILITVYLALGVVAILITFFLLDNIKVRTEMSSASPKDLILNTVNHLRRDKRQQLLVPLTMYSGFKQAFLAADFTESYVSCALGVQWVGLVLCGYGLVDSIVSWAAGIVGSKLGGRFGRGYLLGIGFGMDLCTMTALLLWRPYPTSLIPFFWMAILLSVTDGIFQTQLYTVYGVEFNNNTDAAFSNFRFWEALGFCIAYGYSAVLPTNIKAYIILGIIFISFIGYTSCEYVISQSEQRQVMTINDKEQEVELVTSVDATRARGASFLAGTGDVDLNTNDCLRKRTKSTMSASPQVIINEAFEEEE